jgi:NodT family efflux transporter outer membrane factor (OMF) lipoprotein
MFLLCLPLAACAVGPDFHAPKPPDAKNYVIPAPPIQDQRLEEGAEVPRDWWKAFGSPALDHVIERALLRNPTLKAAEAALRAARETALAQEGAYYPSLEASYSANRQKVAPSVAGSSPIPGNALLFNLHTAQLQISYMPDVLGLNRRTVESLVAQADYQRYQKEAAYVTLTSNIVAAAVQEAGLRAQIAAQEETIALSLRLLELAKAQERHGYAMRGDTAQVQAQMAQAEASLPPLRKQLAQTRDQLAALGSADPAGGIPETFTLADLHLPQALPLSLPSRLIAQRPDIQAAEAQLHAASALIGVAIANRLPQFTIDAGGGDIGTVLAHLFNPADRFWSLTGGVTQPLFDGGTLRHKQRSAEAAYDQAEAQYRATVLAALQNVADTLYALRYDAEGEDKAKALLQAAQTQLEVAEAQYRTGYAPFANLLNARQTLAQARSTLAQAQANRLSDSAALFQALGGGWRQKDEIRD